MREGPRGRSKGEVMFATEVSGEIGTAAAPTLIFYRVYHILGHMYTPPPTQIVQSIAQYYHLNL